MPPRGRRGARQSIVRAGGDRKRRRRRGRQQIPRSPRRFHDTFPARPRLQGWRTYTDSWVSRGPFGHQNRGSVSRSVVTDDQLEIAKRLGEHHAQCFFEHIGPVEGGEHHADERSPRRARRAGRPETSPRPPPVRELIRGGDVPVLPVRAPVRSLAALPPHLSAKMSSCFRPPEAARTVATGRCRPPGQGGTPAQAGNRRREARQSATAGTTMTGRSAAERPLSAGRASRCAVHRPPLADLRAARSSPARNSRPLCRALVPGAHAPVESPQPRAGEATGERRTTTSEYSLVVSAPGVYTSA